LWPVWAVEVQVLSSAPHESRSVERLSPFPRRGRGTRRDGPDLRDAASRPNRIGKVRALSLNALTWALGVVLASGCALGSAGTIAGSGRGTTTLVRSPVPLRPTPAWVRAACGGLPTRTHCPAAIPVSAGRGLTLSVYLRSGRAPFGLLQLEAGGERAGDEHRNRPPHYVGVFVASGRLDRAFPAIFPKRTAAPVVVRDGLANVPSAHGRSFGARRWAGIRGRLSLAPSRGPVPLVYFHYLLFRWREPDGEGVIGLHAWEPFTETVQTLHALVDRLTSVGREPLSYPPGRVTDGVAFTRTPPWLLGACRALDTRPICPARIPAAQSQISLFFEPYWRGAAGSAVRQDLLSVSWGAPGGSAFTVNRPPRFLHLDLLAGDVPVHRRFSRPAVRVRDGLMRLTGAGEAAGRPIPLGHRDWSGRRGVLVLGDCFSNHVCYRWEQHGHTYQVDMHGWEPFTHAVAVLRSIVASAPARSRR
jgi:hypothetical protein